MIKDGEDLVYQAIGNRNIFILCMGMFPYIDKGDAGRTVQSRKAENSEMMKNE